MERLAQAMAKELQGRAVIVVGAGAGKGRALARRWAAAGVNIFAVDANPDRAAGIAEEIVNGGGCARPWQADLANRFQAAAMIESARDSFGRVSALAYCADLAPRRALLTLDEWEWRRLLDVNLSGAFFATQLMARVMSDEGGGVILLCHDPPARAENPASAATRAGVAALAEHADAQLRRARVRVQALSALPDEADSAFADRALREICRLLAAVETNG